MPEKEIIGKYEMDPNYDLTAAVKKEVEDLRHRFEHYIELIDSITDRDFQLLCMFSMIDSLAQEWANYPPKNEQDVFCDFVLKHQTKYDYLNEIEPVTLYYDVEDEIGDEEFMPGFPYIKCVLLDGPCSHLKQRRGNISTSAKHKRSFKLFGKHNPMILLAGG